MKFKQFFYIFICLQLLGYISCNKNTSKSAKKLEWGDSLQLYFHYSSFEYGKVSKKNKENIEFWYVYNLKDTSKLDCIFTEDSGFVLDSKFKVGYVLEDSLLKKKDYVKTIPYYSRYIDIGNGWWAIDTLAPSDFQFRIRGFIKRLK